MAAESASELVSLVDPARDGVVTDERGQWRIAALTPGSYRFVARKAGQAPGGTPPTQVDARGARDITITLPAAARLAGLVTDTSGAPVPFATVRAVVDEGAWGHAVARQVTCSASGEFELAGLPRKLVN
ncbi:MAG TPA: carboxypeptidase-like regulatory domain-containing protein, partial [Ilumatobacteraceae bacterium]|nr:carboxypeptidase-like regulatory domain-containing protein [Ilumatobacteraceae bacterium]